MRYILIIFSLILLLTVSTSLAQVDSLETDTTAAVEIAPPAPVIELTVSDKENDHGHALVVEWGLSADDGAGNNSVLLYDIFRSESPDSGFVKVGSVPSGNTRYDNIGILEKETAGYIPDNTDLYYRVDAVTSDKLVRGVSGIFGPAQSKSNWFHNGRIPVLLAVLFFTGLMVYFVYRARKGAELYVRPLAGIDAVDDAIGRATEMGRPILYVMGLGTAEMIATIASFTILSRVAKQVAEYQTDIIVPCYDPIVMTVAQEVVKSAYLDAGRPDAYKDDCVFYITTNQFAYVAAVNGIMVRDLPATNIYMGKFYAESLMLAETGASAGSIQIAGTDEVGQLPFFIVACDYTLIGEELYAASAYLGREPVMLGSLKAQDYAKAAVIVLGVIGLLAANFGWTAFTDIFKIMD